MPALNPDTRAAVKDILEALKAWQFYYEGHSTAENRERAFWMSRQALYRFEEIEL